MIVVGLTGSIGMGKTTTAGFFRAAGVPVHDADAVVHALYSSEAVAPIEAAFPGTVIAGVVDRARLGARVLGDVTAVARLEAIVHPLVRAAEERFRASARAAGRAIVVLDVPLLVETGGADRVDVVVTVTARPEIQRARVLARPGMTEATFERILARQASDAEKRRRSHAWIDTSDGLDPARRQVAGLLRVFRGMIR
jgi:dephospho-CoA kinase